MISMFYVPCSNQGEAEAISRKLLEEKLVACANILSDMQSLYFWQGALENARETALILKTIPELKEQLTQRIKELHSYSCPCILEWRIESVNHDYADWVRSSLAIK